MPNLAHVIFVLTDKAINNMGKETNSETPSSILLEEDYRERGLRILARIIACRLIKNGIKRQYKDCPEKDSLPNSKEDL